MENKYIELEKILPKENIKYNEPMSKHTTTKVGGNAACFCEPSTIEQIVEIVKFAKENNLKYYIIGNGSNLLVLDSGIDGLVIRIGDKFSSVNVNGNEIFAYAGASLANVARKAMENSLTGLEFACGIPGAIGGAVRMNAGAYGSEMKNVISSVTYLDENLDVKKVDNTSLCFSYRHSIFVEKKEYIVLGATFALENGNKEEIKAKMDELMLARKTKQPVEYPSFGSVFKRPGEGLYVGKMIEECGLKGYSIGGAEVSTKHAGFIINTGNATCKDVLDLIEYIKEKVYEKFNVKLQEEVVILGGE